MIHLYVQCEIISLIYLINTFITSHSFFFGLLVHFCFWWYHLSYSLLANFIINYNHHGFVRSSDFTHGWKFVSASFNFMVSTFATLDDSGISESRYFCHKMQNGVAGRLHVLDGIKDHGSLKTSIRYRNLFLLPELQPTREKSRQLRLPISGSMSWICTASFSWERGKINHLQKSTLSLDSHFAINRNTKVDARLCLNF